jgi:hypothetical protein
MGFLKRNKAANTRGATLLAGVNAPAFTLQKKAGQTLAGRPARSLREEAMESS